MAASEWEAAKASASAVATGLKGIGVAFPTEAPFRIDQVMASPWLTGGLFVIQVALAAASSVAAKRRSQRGWWAAQVGLLAVTAVFFGLASWGTSDIAKLNFFVDPARAATTPLQELLPSEPLWWWLAPLVSHLPYRMASVHGLVVAGFAAIPMLLARSWRVRLWAGWWSLLIVTSPLLRGFFQNAHSRQAMATLLAMPLFLWAISWMRWRPWLMLGSSALALSVHLTALPTLLLAALPALASCSGWSLTRRRWLSAALALITVLVVWGLWGPIAMKLSAYGSSGFFSSYPIKTEVLRCQFVLMASVVFIWVRQRLTWASFWSQREGKALALFLLLYGLIQASVVWRFWPHITFRFGDPVGIFLLLSYLAWLQRRQALRMVLPYLLLSLLTWADRVFWPEGLNCGFDDDFLCLPDRWPWLIRYPYS